MSADRRRQCRVQGGWSRSASGNSSQGGFGSSSHRGQTLHDKPLCFTDPKKVKMPSRKPYNFSWVVPGLLAGSGLPEQPAHVQFYLDEKIDILVSLTEWKPSLSLAPGLQHVHLPVEEFAPPSLTQAIEFVRLLERAKENEKAVAVHCHWGRGRTGTLIACYLVKSRDWDPVTAITATRQARPHSVETRHQEQLVIDYHQHLQQSSNNANS